MTGVAFASWDPLLDLLAIQHRLNRQDGPGPADWTPAVDLYETVDRYTIVAEVPGMRQDDIHIEAHDGRVALAGTRHPRRGGAGQFHRLERGYGTFRRTFQLPHAVDAARITADLREGVLTVTCPKLPEASARRVRIS
jgi:HSP20 family protein